MQNFVPAIISYKHYSTIEHYTLSTPYHFLVQIAKFCIHKRCFKPKLQKRVPANNCHLKVCLVSYTVTLYMSSVYNLPVCGSHSNAILLFIPCSRFDIKSTVAELEQILLHPPPPPSSSSQRESVDGCGFSKAIVSGQAKSPATKGVKSGVRGSGTAGSPAKRKLFKSEEKEQKQDGKGSACTYRIVCRFHM